MTRVKALKVDHSVKAIIAILLAGLCGVFAVAQVPSSGSAHHLSNVAVATPQAGSNPAVGGLSLNKDGWHTWTVEAVQNAPSWCCNSWRGKEVVGATCDLDSRSYGFSRQSKNAVADEMQIYVKIADGQADSIRTYGASCTVVTQNEVIDHGKVGPSASLDWLGRQLSANEHLNGDALAAIAVHDSDQAQRLLEASAHSNQPLETRKQSIFWMGQVRARQSVGDLTRLMTTDDVEEIREHAVFSVSQSTLKNRLALIEQVARNDSAPEVRGQAWFWMSQTAEAQTRQRILSGMQAETDRSVLKQAVFALSQLPGEDAVDALIFVIEQSSYDRDVRKQALFWMAQSDSGRAVDYLANVFDR